MAILRATAAFLVGASFVLGGCGGGGSGAVGAEPLPVGGSLQPTTAPGSVATPTASPTPAPTPTPAVITAYPSTGVTICPSSGAAQCPTNTATITVSESDFLGTITESDSCDPTVAKVNPVAATGPTETFQVVGQSTTGTCRAVFTGNSGSQAGVPIIVTSPGVGIDLRPSLP